MEKALTTGRLALQNIRRKPFRTAALLAVTALASAALFASLIITSSLRGGISGLKERLGADMMVVPEGHEVQMESILLSGEPNYFYMDKNAEDAVRSVPGVKQASGQFFLTSLSESCCDFPIQIIGFDPGTDFIVQAWARRTVSARQQGDGTLFAGNNITTERGIVRFFDQDHAITSKLSKSGCGMDNAIYADLDTLQHIVDDARGKGFAFITDGNTRTKVSAVFVKLEEGAKPDSTALRIKAAVPGAQVISGSAFIANLSGRINGFLLFPRVLCALILIIAAFTLGIVFSLIANERVREYSVLRVLGADSGTLRELILSEAAAIGVIGSAAGLFVAALAVLPYNVLISERIGLPFSLSGPLEIALFALLSVAVTMIACVLAALYSAVKISGQEAIFK